MITFRIILSFYYPSISTRRHFHIFSLTVVIIYPYEQGGDDSAPRHNQYALFYQRVHAALIATKLHVPSYVVDLFRQQDEA